jgi:hypothetical protein
VCVIDSSVSNVLVVVQIYTVNLVRVSVSVWN